MRWAARLLTPSRVQVLLYCSIAAAVAAMTLPLSSFTGHAEWNRIQWIPFGDPAGGLRDDVENIVLFLPFGFFLACRWRASRRAIVRVLVYAALLSACGEFYQVFCPSRYPSVTDVLNNSLGGLLGALAAKFL